MFCLAHGETYHGVIQCPKCTEGQWIATLPSPKPREERKILPLPPVSRPLPLAKVPGAAE